jgi:hypothetical protein
LINFIIYTNALFMKVRHLLLAAILIISLLSGSQARANDRDRDFRSDRDRDWIFNHDRDDRGERGRERESGRGGDDGGARVPLDGGISLLLAAGIGLGVKKVFGKNKEDKAADVDHAGQ